MRCCCQWDQSRSAEIFRLPIFVVSTSWQAKDLQRRVVYITMAQISQPFEQQSSRKPSYVVATNCNHPQGDLQDLEEHSLQSKHAWCSLKTACSSHTFPSE